MKYIVMFLILSMSLQANNERDKLIQEIINSLGKKSSVIGNKIKPYENPDVSIAIRSGMYRNELLGIMHADQLTNDIRICYSSNGIILSVKYKKGNDYVNVKWDPIESLIKEKGMKFLLKQDIKFFFPYIEQNGNLKPLKTIDDIEEHEVFDHPYIIGFDKKTKKVKYIKIINI